MSDPPRRCAGLCASERVPRWIGRLGVGADHCTQGDVRCWCEMSGDDTAEWNCGTEAERQSAVEAIDPATPGNGLSADQRKAWCDWYASNSPVSWHLSPVSDTGCTLNTGETWRGQPSALCVPWLAPSQCEGNLALSDCAASISSLTNCIEPFMIHDSSPDGCVPYFESPNCAGTIAIDRSRAPWSPDDSLCSVVVE